MKNLLVTLIFLLSLFTLGFSNLGCSSSPAARIQQSRLLLNSTLQTIDLLSAEGTITHDELQAILPLADAASVAIDQAQLDQANGDTVGVDVALSAFITYESDLAKLQVKGKARKQVRSSSPTSLPTTRGSSP